jgi:CDP-diacylglycerol--glycerol-3-phosphate 3-phosphatidyltransferase
MTLSNILTITRFILSFVFVGFLFCNGLICHAIALVVFVFAAFTDFLDGFLARIRNEQTFLGQVMDPIADKVLTLFAFGSFAYLKIIPWWIFIVISMRDIMVTIIRLVFFKGNGRILESSFKGKQKTFFQLLSILLVMGGIIFNDIYRKGYYPYNFMENYDLVVSLSLSITVALTVLSAIDIIKRSVEEKKNETHC